MDLEARIAELDERLRLARSDSLLTSPSYAPAPKHSLDPPSPAPRGEPIALPVYSPQRPTSGEAKREASPWSAVGRRTLQASDDELRTLVDRHRKAGVHHEDRIAESQVHLRDANHAVSQLDAEVERTRRHRDVTDANALRALDDAERRLVDAERQTAHHQQESVELTAQRDALRRQLDEMRLAVSKAEVRLEELQREYAASEARRHEYDAGLREATSRAEEEQSANASIRRRLEARVQDLRDENKRLAEQLRKHEASLHVQQTAWAEQHASNVRDIEVAHAHVQDIQLRLRTAEAEMADRHKEAERSRKAREQRVQELLDLRAAERMRDAERHSADLLKREAAVRKDREAANAMLRSQLEDLVAQVERKRRLRDAAAESVAQLKSQLGQLQRGVEEKAAVAAECESLREELEQLERELTREKSETESLRSAAQKSRDELAELHLKSQHLKEKLDDESRLKQLVANLAVELTEAETVHAEELASLERLEKSLLDDSASLQSALDAEQLEVERVSRDGATQLEALSRRIAACRQDVLDKEAELNRLIGECALKQSTIAQLEEDRRRLEREQSARKASAAQAARAALSELAV